MNTTQKLSIYFLFIAFLCNVQSLSATPKYPEKAMGRPKCFEQNYHRSYDWENIASIREFGELTNNQWTVYVCNQGVKVYEDYDATKEIVHDVSFMEDFYVADIHGDYALLFYCDSNLVNLTIPRYISKHKSTIKHGVRQNGYIGWVNVDNLLLWNIAPKTEDGIFKKIAIVKDIYTAEDFSSMPQLFENPDCTKSGKYSKYINALDFYFTLKKSNGNALVYVNYQLDGKMTHKKVGWVKYGEYIDWNTRICWEPAFGDSINDYAYAFYEEGKAERLIGTSNYSRTSGDAIPAKLSHSRYKPDVPRSPIVNYTPETRIAHLSVLASQNGHNPADDENRRKLEELRKSLQQINIVFVMDATKSMNSCFSAMSKAVKEIASYNYNQNVKFGVVIYRNYKDAPNDLVESIPLTDDFNRIQQFLSSVECKSKAVEHQEAMFYGLNYAMDNMSWNKEQSNFIILISDVSSKNPDDRGYTINSISNKLVSKGINLVAFQARSQAESVYQNFGAQVCDIIKSTLRGFGYPNTNKEVDTKLQIYYYNQDITQNWPLRPMGYKQKLSDENNINPSELTMMATNIIKRFIETTQENVEFLEDIIGGGTAWDVNSTICETLKKMGYECPEDVFRISGYTRRLWQQGKRMFVPCVFLADKELNDLIRDLEQVTKGTSNNRRGELQKVFKKLILSYTGQQLTADAMTDFNRIIRSIELECGYTFDEKVKTHIKNPNLLRDDDIQQLTNRLKNSIRVLKSKQNDNTTYKEQDGNKYYYILLEDMPLVTRQ